MPHDPWTGEVQHVYSVEVFSPDNKASDILPLELTGQSQAEKIVGVLKTLGTNCQVVARTRWEPVNAQ